MITIVFVGIMFLVMCSVGATLALCRAAANGDRLGGYLDFDEHETIPGATL